MAGILKNIWSLCRILGLTKLLSDEMFVRLQYRAMMGKKLRLNPPIDFNEKLQWLKLHYRNPLYVIGADKYEVRKYIEEKGMESVRTNLFVTFAKVFIKEVMWKKKYYHILCMVLMEIVSLIVFVEDV